ncbi:cell wall hydrolase [Halovulum sp. GXIMD14793]
MVRYVKAPQLLRRSQAFLIAAAAFLSLSAVSPTAHYDMRNARVLSWSPLVMEVPLRSPETANKVAEQISVVDQQQRMSELPVLLPNDGIAYRAALSPTRFGPPRQLSRDAGTAIAALSAQDIDTRLLYSLSQDAVEDISRLKTRGFQIERMDHLPPATGDAEWACLTEALYFEARGENLKGQMGVAEVILNRVESARYPDTVCGVVNQGSSRRNACQFSFKCDGLPERFSEPKAYERVGKVARVMLDGHKRTLTDGATHYHTTQVQPGWSRRLTRTAQIGVHVFYRRASQTAMN